MLAVGIKGLQLAGAPSFVDDFFYGAALLLAVGIAQIPNSGKRFGAIRRITGFLRPRERRAAKAAANSN